MLLHHPIQLPYALARLPIAGMVWLPLNRRYKPLGTPPDKRDWVDYLDYAEQALDFEDDPRVWGTWSKATSETVWLTDDSTDPATYFQRLAKLMTQPIRPMSAIAIQDGREEATIEVLEAATGAGVDVAHAAGVLDLRFDGDARLLASRAVARQLDSKLRAALAGAPRAKAD